MIKLYSFYIIMSITFYKYFYFFSEKLHPFNSGLVYGVYTVFDAVYTVSDVVYTASDTVIYLSDNSTLLILNT